MHSKRDLPNVTLIAVTSVDIDQHAIALDHCLKFFKFGKVKFFCSELPSFGSKNIEYLRIPKINFLQYSQFMIEYLWHHIATDFCLVIQADGFILNPEAWTDDFLMYDYIGAPWEDKVPAPNLPGGYIHFDRNRVGNGGFSLRSRRLLQHCKSIKFLDLRFPILSEDIVICHYLFDRFASAGVKFAPPDLAARFSTEAPEPSDGGSIDSSFGFHGRHWMGRVLEKLDGRAHHPGLWAAR